MCPASGFLDPVDADLLDGAVEVDELGAAAVVGDVELAEQSVAGGVDDQLQQLGLSFALASGQVGALSEAESFFCEREEEVFDAGVVLMAARPGQLAQPFAAAWRLTQRE